MIEIRYKDIDPDSGDITNDQMICLCLTDRISQLVLLALVRDCEDPNREFYIKKYIND